jgi:hypothetical protein
MTTIEFPAQESNPLMVAGNERDANAVVAEVMKRLADVAAREKSTLEARWARQRPR